MSRSIALRRSPIHGNGVFAVRNITTGIELIEYQGKRMTHAEADEHYEGDVDSGHTFLFTLNEHYVIDGNQNGNDARWINHSCDPNCEALLIENEDGDPAKDRVVIESLREIRRGEELTYNYGIVLEERHTARLKKLWECRCGSPKCTGTLLQPKRRKKSG
jgi:SET domain-containing protein